MLALVPSFYKEIVSKPGMAVHAYNPDTQEKEVLEFKGGLSYVSLRHA